MFKDFKLSSFKKLKPPGDNTFHTMQELKELNKIPLNKKFVKDYDDTVFVDEALHRLVEIYFKIGRIRYFVIPKRC
jgi:hypothetical protein